MQDGLRTLVDIHGLHSTSFWFFCLQCSCTADHRTATCFLPTRLVRITAVVRPPSWLRGKPVRIVRRYKEQQQQQQQQQQQHQHQHQQQQQQQQQQHHQHHHTTTTTATTTSSSSNNNNNNKIDKTMFILICSSKKFNEVLEPQLHTVSARS